MYDADRDAVQAWWQGLASALRAEGLPQVPEALTWPAVLPAHWRDADLLLSQTCGYPLVTQLEGRVQVVGVFRYTAPGCSGVSYRSALVARRDDPGRSIGDFRHRVAAFNDRGSHSGFNALRHLIAPLAVAGRFFARAIESGSHRASIDLVRSGAADLASIDAVTWAGLRRVQPSVDDDLKVLGLTAAVPGLPLITSSRTTPEELSHLRRALAAACADKALAATREALFIKGFCATGASPWRVIDAQRRHAEDLGCSDL